MFRNKRYHFWRVFWVVLAVYALLIVFAIISTAIVPGALPKTELFKKYLGWKALLVETGNIFYFALFYFVMLNVYYLLIVQKRNAIEYIKYSLLAVFLIAVYFTVEQVTEIRAMHLPLGVLAYYFAVSAILYVCFSLVIAYFTYLRDEKKRQKILEDQKLQLEVEISQANLNFLKSQINPHFLHNTLNFLYSKSLPYSPELSEGILTLSDIMRYALSEGNARDGKAPLKDEIEHVRNVIRIQQLRFRNSLNVEFTVEGVLNTAKIIPFVLITIVENAFKHGDLKNTESPIVIKLREQDNSLYFFCRNKKKNGPKELSTGIGLDNIRKRLDLAYKGNYSITVKDETDFYTTELNIEKL